MVQNKLPQLGYRWILLDDCWAATSRDANHSIQPDRTRFPSGMTALADYLHKFDLKLGLYTDVGNKTCKGGRTGSWDRYEQDALMFAKWGIDYVKMDWCGHPGDAKTLYTRMSRAINATGRQMAFGLCEWGLYNVWEWAGEIANLWRVGPDQ
jgi:alpha-galactosidase